MSYHIALHAFYRACERDLDLAQGLARELAQDLEHNLERACAFELELAQDLEHDLQLAHKLALNLEGELELELARELELDLAHACDLVHPRDLERVHAVVALIGHALERSKSMERILQERAAKKADRNSTTTPGRVSRGLVALAVRVLPRRERPRYAEEFRTELVELRRRNRLGHAVRVLGRAWELRRALTELGRAPGRIPARRPTER